MAAALPTIQRIEICVDIDRQFPGIESDGGDVRSGSGSADDLGRKESLASLETAAAL